MIAAFKADNPSIKIYVCTPLPAYPGRWGINDTTIREEVAPKVRQVAQDTGATVIDLYAAMSGKPELFLDTVHPNAAGARLVAAAVRQLRLVVYDRGGAIELERARRSGKTAGKIERRRNSGIARIAPIGLPAGVELDLDTGAQKVGIGGFDRCAGDQARRSMGLRIPIGSILRPCRRDTGETDRRGSNC